MQSLSKRGTSCDRRILVNMFRATPARRKQHRLCYASSSASPADLWRRGARTYSRYRARESAVISIRTYDTHTSERLPASLRNMQILVNYESSSLSEFSWIYSYVSSNLNSSGSQNSQFIWNWSIINSDWSDFLSRKIKNLFFVYFSSTNTVCLDYLCILICFLRSGFLASFFFPNTIPKNGFSRFCWFSN